MSDTASFESFGSCWILLDLLLALYMGPTCWIKMCYTIYGTYVLDQDVLPYIWDLRAGSRCVTLYMGPSSKDQNLRKKGV